eukprot:9678505-Heterocapsa_arctica.AAC.1
MLQKVLFENPRRAELTTKFTMISDMLNIVKDTHRAGCTLQPALKECHKTSSEVRRRARVAIGTDYALDQVLHHNPDTHVKLKQHAAMIVDKTTKKG